MVFNSLLKSVFPGYWVRARGWKCYDRKAHCIAPVSFIFSRHHAWLAMLSPNVRVPDDREFRVRRESKRGEEKGELAKE